MNKPGTNSGHGHIWTRPDGIVARCGGPAICPQCKHDQTLSFNDFPSVEEMHSTSVQMPREISEKILIALRDWSADRMGRPIGNEAATSVYNAIYEALKS